MGWNTKASMLCSILASLLNSLLLLESTRTIWRTKAGRPIVAGSGCTQVRATATAIAAARHIVQTAAMAVWVRPIGHYARIACQRVDAGDNRRGDTRATGRDRQHSSLTTTHQATPGSNG